jgi:hypothetical protein
MSTQAAAKFASFKEFYPFYLGEHSNRQDQVLIELKPMLHG